MWLNDKPNNADLLEHILTKPAVNERNYQVDIKYSLLSQFRNYDKKKENPIEDSQSKAPYHFPRN